MNALKTKIRSLSDDTQQRLTVVLALIILCAVFAVGNQYFLTLDNILLTLYQSAVNGITACGILFVIITQAVDLSLGSTIAVCGCICAALIANGVPAVIAVIVALIGGAIIGVINGFCVARMKLPPFVATLGMQMVLRGSVLVAADAKPIYLSESNFKQFAQYKLFDIIQLPVLYLILLCLVTWFILRKTVIGRHLFAVGSNEDAAKLSGIKTHRVRMFAYGYCGVMSAFAGCVLTARLSSGQPTVGVGYEANAIAACVIGGASMSGGKGTVGGTILGAIIMGVLLNGLNLLSISSNWQTIATGLVVIGAVYLDRVRHLKES